MALYIKLYHGATSSGELITLSMDGNWGSEGPYIGPLSYVQITYGSHIKFDFVHPEDREKFFQLPGTGTSNPEFWWEDGLIFFVDTFYGDMQIVDREENADE